MPKSFVALLAAFALVNLASIVDAAAGSSGTVRIETRPFYGATSTIENGVRVIRPLPPHRLVIINPHGKAKLAVTVEDRRIIKIGGGHSQAIAIGGDGGYGGGYHGLPLRRHDRHRPRVGVGGHPGYPGLYRVPAHRGYPGHGGRR